MHRIGLPVRRRGRKREPELNAATWLVHDDQLISIKAKPTDSRTMFLTGAQQNFVLLSSILFLPAIVLGAGHHRSGGAGAEMNPRVDGRVAGRPDSTRRLRLLRPDGPDDPGSRSTTAQRQPTVVQLDLWKLDDGQIQTIEVQRGPDRAVRRTSDGWVVLAIRRGGRRPARQQPGLPARQPPGDLRGADSVTNLDEYGLGTLALVATLSMVDGSAHTLKLGTKAPAEAGTYALKDAETTVYLISNAIGAGS